MADYPSVSLKGLHGRADGGNAFADFECIRVGKVEAFKLMTTMPADDVDRARQAGATFFVCRIYEDLNNRIVTPEQFANWQLSPDSSMRRMYAKGVRHFEVANEPNLKQEGMWQSWNNGVSFGIWFVDVINRLRTGFPDAFFGFPGLSPGGDMQNVRYDATRFWNEALFAMRQADWIAAHAYEVYNTTDLNAGGAWRIPRSLVPDKPLAITEFSSPLQSTQTQAKQYRAYYEKLRHEKNVFVAFAFVVSGTHFQHESWRTEAGQLNAIPFEVAKTNFSTSPMPKPYTLIPSPYRVVVNDAFNGAGVIARDLNGNSQQVFPPGTEFTVYSNGFTIPNHPEYGLRLIVNPSNEWNILASRLAPDTTRNWEIAANALLANFGPDRDKLITMLAIGAAESAQYTQDRGDKGLGNPIYQCEGYASFSPWQIYAPAHFDKYTRLTGSTDPCEWYKWTHNWKNAAKIAKEVLDSSSYNAWSVYKNGAYKTHLPRATTIVDELLSKLPLSSGGYDSPVGTPEERATLDLWPGQWKSAWHPSTGYGKVYKDSAGNTSVHSGDDINKNSPIWNSDAHSPVYAASDGIVRFAGRVGNFWRNIIVIEHSDNISTRYAHVENMLVVAGDTVRRGQQICQVGQSGGTGGNYHIHYDVCTTGVILTHPGHWPGSSLQGVLSNYVDPLKWTREHRPR